MSLIIVLGASGDLARRKTYPALFCLYLRGLLVEPFHIFGFARTNITRSEFQARLQPNLNKVLATRLENAEAGKNIDDFYRHCDYVCGQYDAAADYEALKKKIMELENFANHKDITYIFYLALPPSVFISAARCLHQTFHGDHAKCRLVVEKPFGKDSKSSTELTHQLAPLFNESEIFRIDHYLGKEMVKNILVLRFSNVFFNAIWDRNYIDNIQIVFKETIGVEGRGGYFDEYGIIRDVMQNHLLQLLTVIAMERPTSLSAEDVRDEKVKVLRSIEPINLSEVVVGQYTRGVNDASSKPAYIDDPTVPRDSKCPTFALVMLKINNERWEGVPFFLRCGKALDQQKSEIRIQFSKVPGLLFPPDSIERNELIIRIQPNESVYLKMMVKKPGLETETILSDLDLSYSTRYDQLYIPDAYESLILDILRNDHSNFVRADELTHAWNIFTPLLKELEEKKISPIPYPHGTRGPAEADEFLEKTGFKRHSQAYDWPKQSLLEK